VAQRGPEEAKRPRSGAHNSKRSAIVASRLPRASSGILIDSPHLLEVGLIAAALSRGRE
jgi:hypothetical protein